MSTKSYYTATVRQFLSDSHEDVLARLALRVSSEYRGDERSQIKSWRRQLEILRHGLEFLGAKADQWGLLLEFPISRMRKRLDAVIVAPGSIFVIEFKIGENRFATSDIAQVEDYALCLRDFHAAAREKQVIPILCAELARTVPFPNSLQFFDCVASVALANASNLGEALSLVHIPLSDKVASSAEFDAAPYQPVPTIVEAAQAVYRGHTVAEIGRADAAVETLALAAGRLKAIAAEAKAKSKKVICFVTGTPGAGKTLLGLNLVLAEQVGRVSGEPAAFLSGNRPLVHVLTEALVEDARGNGQLIADVRRSAAGAIQTLLGYLRHHTDDPHAPPESVLVYDEAQRAWDAETGDVLLGRRESEPALFLEILNRLPWACLVCLVGPGQEINRGEGGLRLWADALRSAVAKGQEWEVHAAQIGDSGGGVQSIFSPDWSGGLAMTEEPSLHLSACLRTYRNEQQIAWVDALLSGDLERAGDIARRMKEPPAYVTRSLTWLRKWLQVRQRGERRTGLLVSSAAVRLGAEGILPAPRSNDLASIGNWFLKPSSDFRSSNALETPMSEYACQGLELDYAGLCWGHDLVWEQSGWKPRKMQAPYWRAINRPDRKQFRLNAYRVLMTRARVGLAIYVPEGDPTDGTRGPREFAGIVDALRIAGCHVENETAN